MSGTPHARRTDLLPRAKPREVLHQTHGQRRIDLVSRCRRKSTSLACQTRSSPAPKHESAVPTPEIPAAALCLLAASPDRRGHLRETDRQTQLLRFLRRLLWHRFESSATHIVRWSMAKAAARPRAEALRLRPAARPDRAERRAWLPGRPLH